MGDLALPLTWITSEFSKQRTTWTIASHSRMLARNWLPRPSPLEAPCNGKGGRMRRARNLHGTSWFSCPCLDQASDVNKLAVGGNNVGGLRDVGKDLEPRVRDVDHTHVGLDLQLVAA